MKRLVSIIMILVLISSFGMSFGNASVKTDEGIRLIEEYFAVKDKIFKISDAKNFNQLNEMFTSEANEYLNYESGRLKYWISADKITGVKVKQYDTTIEVTSETIKENEIEYEVAVVTEIEYDFLKKVEYNRIYHTIVLKLENGMMKIDADKYSDEFKDLYGLGTDFESLIKEIKSYNDISHKSSDITTIKESEDIFSIKSDLGDYYDTYSSTDRSSAVSYALSHTDDTGSYATTYYNKLQFKTYGTADCQNFVSQSIWSGFGGNSSADKNLPMVPQWWANLTGEDSYNNWVGTSYFKTWITNNYQYNDYGIKGYETSVSNMLEGDYVYVPGHTMFITSADDEDDDGTVEYNEIYISSHTHNRKDHSLISLFGTQPSNMKFLHITGFKWNTGF